MCTKDAAHFHILTEYCAHGALDARLRRDASAGHLRSDQQLSWVLATCEGVLHLHQHNVIHRDLAARNLLLDEEDT